MATTITPIKNELDQNNQNRFLTVAFARAFEKGAVLHIGGSTYKCLMVPKIYQINIKDLNHVDFEFLVQALLVEREDGMIYEIRATDLANVASIRLRADKGVDLFSEAVVGRNGYCLAYMHELVATPPPEGTESTLDANAVMACVIQNLCADISCFIKGINGQKETIVLPE